MAKNSFHSQRHRRRWLFFRFMALAWGGLLLMLLWSSSLARGGQLPPAERSYPLPSRLEVVLKQQKGSVKSYLDQIAPSPQGYLLWSSWPVRIYLEPLRAGGEASASETPVSAQARRQATWLAQAEVAIADWSRYVPLELTSEPDQAQITILRRQPPLRWDKGQFSRARHAETRFRIASDRDAQGQPCLRHRQTLYVGDRQGPQQLRGTLRHELGHALGLWGHSPDPGDALYAGQVADPPAISPRDLKTLGELYGQPTRLGCLVGLPQPANELRE